MKSLGLLLAIFAISGLNCVFVEFDYTNDCDFSFGDPSWNYSKVFYNRDYYINSPDKHLKVEIRKQPGYMVSFVCINVDGTPKENVIADYTALFQRVTVLLKRPEFGDVHVNIIAKHHGY